MGSDGPARMILKSIIMGKHFFLSDSAFERQFADMTLPTELFDHVGHLRTCLDSYC